MEINDVIVSWLFLAVLLAYPVFSILIVVKSFAEKDKRGIFIAELETAIKRTIVSVLGFFLLLFIVQIVNDHTDYKVLSIMPVLFKQTLTG